MFNVIRSWQKLGEREGLDAADVIFVVRFAKHQNEKSSVVDDFKRWFAQCFSPPILTDAFI